jgi:hypothetical protein
MPRSTSSSKTYGSNQVLNRNPKGIDLPKSFPSTPAPPKPPVPPKSLESTTVQHQHQVQVETQKPTFMSTVFQGVAWGMGTTMGRRLFEPRIDPEPHSNHSNHSNPTHSNHSIQSNQVSPTPTIETPNNSVLDSNEIFKKYQECIERKDTDVSCEMLLTMSSK